MTQPDPVAEFDAFPKNSRVHAAFWLTHGYVHPEAHHTIVARLTPWIARVTAAGGESWTNCGRWCSPKSLLEEPPKMTGPAVPPPSPVAVTEYFRRRRSSISEFTPDDILHNERLWVVEICGLHESELDPAPIITREQAARRDDPFSDKRKFGPIGQYTKCVGCGAVFESLGLRSCAGCCRSSHAAQTKRCQECGAPLPPRGRKTLRFCSDACRQKAHRGGLAVTDLLVGRLPHRDSPVSVTAAQSDQALTDPPNRNTTPVRCAACRREFQVCGSLWR